MVVDRAGHQNVGRAEVRAGTTEGGGIGEGHLHVVAVGTCTHAAGVEAGRQGRRAAGS